jgi:hypothetical protein
MEKSKMARTMAWIGILALIILSVVPAASRPVVKEPKDMSYAELAQEMYKREDSLDHLIAKAEMARRAAEQARWNGRCMLASVIIAAFAAIASACSAYFAFVAGRRPACVNGIFYVMRAGC